MLLLLKEGKAINLGTLKIQVKEPLRCCIDAYQTVLISQDWETVNWDTGLVVFRD